MATSAGATISVRCDRPSTVAVQPGSNDALSTTTPARRIRTLAATSPCCSVSDSAKTVPAGVAGDGCGSRGSGPAGLSVRDAKVVAGAREPRVQQGDAAHADVAAVGRQCADDRAGVKDAGGAWERPQRVRAGPELEPSGDGRPGAGGDDEVVDPEQPVIARVALSEVVLGIGHQRGGAQRVADLVDVAALEVLEHRHRPDGEVLAPIGRHPGVRPPAAVALDHRDEAIELGAPGVVRAALGVDRGAVVAVVGAELHPRGREHDDRPCEQDGRGQAGRPPRYSGFEQPHAAGRQPRRAATGEQQRGELRAHHEAAEEQVGAARDQIGERPERRATEREQQAHRERDHQGAGIDVRGPRQPRQSESERREHGHDGQPAMVEQPAGDQPVKDATRAVAVLQGCAAHDLVGRRPLALGEQRDDHPRRREQRTAE